MYANYWYKERPMNSLTLLKLYTTFDSSYAPQVKRSCFCYRVRRLRRGVPPPLTISTGRQEQEFKRRYIPQ